MAQKKLEIEYKKGKDFATYFVTGAYGGFSGHGNVCMNFYIDRIAIPDKVELGTNKEGVLVEMRHQGDDVIGVREVIACIMMSPDNAKDFHRWLGDKLAQLENTIKNR